MKGEPCSEQEGELVEELLQRIASDISMITDRDFLVTVKGVNKWIERPTGKGKIHISFRFGFQQDDGVRHGCLLLPLADAISLACYLMMVPDDGVKGKRSLNTLEDSIKDAMLEVGNFVGGAADAALREAVGIQAKVRSEGCQGVKPNTRPALIYDEGTPLLIGRAKGKIHDYPEFEMLIMVPELAGIE
jgi:hypothetical protein